MQQVDGLGRNAAMYCVHGNTPAHLECLQILITADCDLDLQANGMTPAWIIFEVTRKTFLGYICSHMDYWQERGEGDGISNKFLLIYII